MGRPQTSSREYNSPQFVALEVNFWECPQTLMLARFLGEDPLLAGARIAKLREFVLTSGDFAGAFKASADEIAVCCRWQGQTRTLVSALQKARVITGRRLLWRYVDWDHTRTGYYQQRRGADAEWHRQKREEERRHRQEQGAGAAAARGGGVSNSNGASADGLTTSSDFGVGRKKERTSADGRPPEPPEGESERLAAWEWFENTYPNPKNPERTRKAFMALTLQDIERIRIHVPRVLLKKNPRFVPGSDKYIREATFRSIRDPSGAKKPGKPAPAEPKSGADDHAQEVNRAMMARAVELKRQLKAQGLTGAALEEAVDTRLQAELKKGAFGVVKPPAGPHA